MKNKVNPETLKAELMNLADDFNFEGEIRDQFIEQVTDYVIGTEVESWDGVYCYVDGLLTSFNHNFNLA